MRAKRASFDRTNRSRDGGGAIPGSIGFQIVAGASVSASDCAAGASLEVLRERLPPRISGLLPLSRGHRHLHQLFGLGKRRGRDRRAEPTPVPESGRRSGVPVAGAL
jgi:hypothetical protein